MCRKNRIEFLMSICLQSILLLLVVKHSNAIKVTKLLVVSLIMKDHVYFHDSLSVLKLEIKKSNSC